MAIFNSYVSFPKGIVPDSRSLSLSLSVSLHRLAHIYEYAFKGASDVRSMSSVGPIVDHWSPRQCFGFEQSWLRVAIGSPNCNLVSDQQQLTAEPTKVMLSHFTCHVDKWNLGQSRHFTNLGENISPSQAGCGRSKIHLEPSPGPTADQITCLRGMLFFFRRNWS